MVEYMDLVSNSMQDHKNEIKRLNEKVNLLERDLNHLGNLHNEFRGEFTKAIELIIQLGLKNQEQFKLLWDQIKDMIKLCTHNK